MFLSLPVALAYADGAPAAGPGAGFMSFLPLVLLFVIFYFLLIRPQQKKAKEHKEMLTQLNTGDYVITTGGIHGRITAVSEDAFTVEIADKVRIKITRDSVMAKKPKG